MDKNTRIRTYQERLLSWLIWKLDARLERLSEQAWIAHEEAYYAQNFTGKTVEKRPCSELGICLCKKPVTYAEGWCGCAQPDCKRGCGC